MAISYQVVCYPEKKSEGSYERLLANGIHGKLTFQNQWIIFESFEVGCSNSLNFNVFKVEVKDDGMRISNTQPFFFQFRDLYELKQAKEYVVQYHLNRITGKELGNRVLESIHAQTNRPQLNQSDFGDRYFKSISSRTDPDESSGFNTFCKVIKYGVCGVVGLLLATVIFDDFFYVLNGRTKATPLSVLAITEPPRVSQLMNGDDSDSIPQYQSLYKVGRLVSLLEDTESAKLFLINSNFSLEMDPKTQDVVLYGLTNKERVVYGFQLNIFDKMLQKDMSLEKAVILSGRYLPWSVINAKAKDAYTYTMTDSRVYCYNIPSGFSWMIVKDNRRGWIIYGGPVHSYCSHPINESEKWDMNFSELFDKSDLPL